MASASSNIELYQRLNTELMTMVEQFTNLVKATKEGLDSDERPQERDGAAAAAAAGATGGVGPGVRDRRVPGELLEVLAEKLLVAGHNCVHTVSELKKGAVISDFEALTRTMQAMDAKLQTDTYDITRGLLHIRREAEGLLGKLEQHYYSSAHRGPPPSPQLDPAAATIAELCAQAQAMLDEL